MRVFGWRALMLQGDPCVWDRYRWVRRHLGSGATFDAGAGNGGFSIFAASRGNPTVGLSFAEPEMRAAQRRAALCGAEGADFEVGDLRRLDTMDQFKGRFRQVLCLEVAEHILDDEKLFRDLFETMEPGARMLFTTPYSGHRPLYHEDLLLSEVEDGGHVRYGYSPEDLQRLAAGAGLRVVEVGYVSGLVSQRLTDVGRRVRPFGSPLVGWALAFPLRLLSPLDRFLTRARRYPCLSITLIAERPA